MTAKKKKQKNVADDLFEAEQKLNKLRMDFHKQEHVLFQKTQKLRHVVERNRHAAAQAANLRALRAGKVKLDSEEANYLWYHWVFPSYTPTTLEQLTRIKERLVEFTNYVKEDEKSKRAPKSKTKTVRVAP